MDHDFTPVEISAYYAARVPNLKPARGGERRGQCPRHKGEDDNFAVKQETGAAYCHSQCQRGWDIVGLEMELSGTDFNTAKAEVCRLVGRRHARNGQHPPAPTAMGRSASNPPSGRRFIEAYEYTDVNGATLFSVYRYLRPDGTKMFYQCRPSGVEAAGTTDSNREVCEGGIVMGLGAGKYCLDLEMLQANGKCLWKKPVAGVDHVGKEYFFRACPRVPYRLPKVLSAPTVYLPEGEKDCHTLETWGLVASCNPGGSGSSHLYAEWTDYFRDRHVVIVPDHDEPGRKHAAAVASTMLSTAASVRVVELPGLGAKGDITDWRDAGGTSEQFHELTAAAAHLDEAALSELRRQWGLADLPANRKMNVKTAHAGSLSTRCLSDIESKPVRWLWPGRLARGKLTMIAGNPGLGKSQITASIAAVVTKGGRWPVDGQLCKVGDVLFLSAEDDPADTLRPRLEAAGADVDRVHIVDGVLSGYTGGGSATNRAFSLQADIEALGSKLAELGDVAAVVIDPISAYLGDTDSHKNAEVRSLLTPLSELAARHDTAIIGVSHLTKSVGSQALMRVSGSLAFVAAARAAYLVTADPKDKARRFFLPMKNNLGPDETGLGFRIEGATVSSPSGPLATSRVVWELEPVSMTADEAMQAENPLNSTSALDLAVDWLRETLVNGPMEATEVFDAAKADGISNKTLQRASKKLVVQKTKPGMTTGWMWSLPPKVAKSSEDAQGSGMATFEEVGHLRSPDGGMTEVEL